MLSAASTPAILAAPSFCTRPSSSPSIRFVTTRAAATTTSYGSAESQTTTSSSSSSSPYLNNPRGIMAASLYEILGIPTVATCQEIKAAYRRLARVCHPDVLAIDRKDSSADEFMKIHAAYSTLSDPAKRADYDRRLLRSHRPLTVASGFSGYTGRNWETDQCW